MSAYVDIWTDEAIQAAYTYHSPTPTGVAAHADLSEAFITITRVIRAAVPEGRERALCRTLLEEAKMWASAGVARNPETR